MTSRKQEGFIVAKKTAMVDFSEDSEWHGVEAKVNGMSVTLTVTPILQLLKVS